MHQLNFYLGIVSLSMVADFTANTQFGEELAYNTNIAIISINNDKNGLCSESGPFKIISWRIVMGFQSLMNKNYNKIVQAWISQNRIL